MEKAYKAIKALLLNDVNDILPEYEDESLTLPKFREDFIVLGTVDLTKYKADLVVSVLPGKQREYDGDIADYTQESALTVTFLVMNDKAERLTLKTFRYVEAFRKAILSNPSLNGEVEDARIETRTYYADAGTADRQVSAVEVEMTISENLELD